MHDLLGCYRVGTFARCSAAGHPIFFRTLHSSHLFLQLALAVFALRNQSRQP